MMASRDTYRDYITDQEACEAGSTAKLNAIRIARMDALWERSGGTNVPNARLIAYHDLSACVLRMRIAFDSRAWTGLA
jgi:hypothetical protein